jgi:tetratricopeptide (TPR) repeat protein
MRRNFVVVLLLFGLAFGALAISKARRGGDEEAAASPDVRERERIARFWNAYHEATRIRAEGDFEAAVERYREALRLRPDHEESLYYLGNCLYELGEYPSALEVYETLVEVNPQSHRGFSQLGVALSTRQPGAVLDPGRARSAFERNAELDREESGPFLRLGMLDLKEGRLEEALADFRRAAGFGSPEGAFRAGFVELRKGRPDRAVDEFLKILDIAAQERRIARMGGRGEGDTRPGEGGHELPPWQWAELKGRLHLFWAAERVGAYPDRVPAEARLERPPSPSLRVLLSDGGPPSRAEAAAAWADLDGDGSSELILAGGEDLGVFRWSSGRLEESARVALPPSVDTGDGPFRLVIGDFGGDGREDVYFVGGGYTEPGENRLFRSLEDAAGGGPRLVDVTAESGLAGRRSTIVAVAADLDGDGRLDLIEGGAAGEHPALRVFWNRGDRFEPPAPVPTADPRGHVVDLAVADVDLDGHLDLFLLRWGRPAKLLRNRGDRSFDDITDAVGLSDLGGDGLAAVFVDYNGDGAPDLLVTTHARHDFAARSLLDPEARVPASMGQRLFENRLDDGFHEITTQAGLDRAFGVRRVVVGDFNRDGRPDLLFVGGGLDDPTHLEPARILLNRAGKGFGEEVLVPGLEPLHSWSAAVADLDGRAHVFLAGAGLFRIE